MVKRIVVVKIRKKHHDNVNEDLRWMGNSLGLFGIRDKDSSCFRMFIILLKHRDKTISSDEIAEKLRLTRGTVVHHLNKLMDAGVVVREKGGYILRENSMQGVIRDMRKDMETMFGELKRAAKEIDEKLGL
tara:strand:- start:93 stop:485 length:393 start_codon:yes stop_codon:yes gene_type:complete